MTIRSEREKQWDTAERVHDGEKRKKRRRRCRRQVIQQMLDRQLRADVRTHRWLSSITLIDCSHRLLSSIGFIGKSLRRFRGRLVVKVGNAIRRDDAVAVRVRSWNVARQSLR